MIRTVLVFLFLIPTFVSGAESTKCGVYVDAGLLPRGLFYYPPPRQPDPQKARVLLAVWKEVENFWKKQFTIRGLELPPVKLIMFSDRRPTRGCGFATRQMGPFYCIPDKAVYLDPEFFTDIALQFGANGIAAKAYVLSHEFGHHIQSVLGVLRKIHLMQEAVAQNALRSPIPNALQRLVENGADAFAGYFMKEMRVQVGLSPEDYESCMQCAMVLGDDIVAETSGRRYNPERSTHGDSVERLAWFTKGIKANSIDEINPFPGAPLPLEFLEGFGQHLANLQKFPPVKR